MLQERQTEQDPSPLHYAKESFISPDSVSVKHVARACLYSDMSNGQRLYTQDATVIMQPHTLQQCQTGITFAL